ncbi:MAG TPA: hypothetical protein VHZ81_01115 [Galbitalea sp.]|nr:hypothetical protein [Galbitalea sp.]
MNDGWVPLGASKEELSALHEGIPNWMVRPFWAWFHTAVLLASQDNGSGADLAQEYDTLRRMVSPLAARAASYGLDEAVEGRADFDLSLSVTDFLVAKLIYVGHDEHVDALEAILESAGSAWHVGTRGGYAGLERRVPAGVQVAAEAAMALGGHAGGLLSEAWHAAFGAQPNPELAYSKAVKAAEAAAIPVVLPKDGSGTLGRVFAQMKVDGNWTLPLAREHADHPTSSVLMGMVQALWNGQDDRHAGQPNYRPSPQEAAETAVLLAVPLVQWFSDGTIARR